MVDSYKVLEQRERRAEFGLWSIPGIGVKGLQKLRSLVGSLEALLEVPVSEWFGQVQLTQEVRDHLQNKRGTLAKVADRVEQKARKGGMEICFRGDGIYPDNLAGVPDAPPILFYRGAVHAPRRKLAMVGTRHAEAEALRFAQHLASQVAQLGVCVVSGAAFGIDSACHMGALEAGGETWAFLGSGLDEMDPHQKALCAEVGDRGLFFTEFPPGTRATQMTFPRRNRLISGAADAVLIVRAGVPSGTDHTVTYAQAQGRPLLAVPGEPWAPSAAGTNALLTSGKARACTSAIDACRATGAVVGQLPMAIAEEAADLSALSPSAKQAFDVLTRNPQLFEDVMRQSGVDAARLTSALTELELLGLAIQHPGKLYERI